MMFSTAHLSLGHTQLSRWQTKCVRLPSGIEDMWGSLFYTRECENKFRLWMHLSKQDSDNFSIGTYGNAIRSFLHIVLTYHRKTDVHGVKHGATAHSCVRLLVSWKDKIDVKKKTRRDDWGTQHIYTDTEGLEGQYRLLLKNSKQRESRVQNPAIRSNLDSLLRSKTANMLAELQLTNIVRPSDAYSIFRNEALHLFHISVYKLFQGFTAAYLPYRESPKWISRNSRRRRGQDPIKAQFLHVCNNLLAAYEKDLTISALHNDFSTSQNTGLLNGFFMASVSKVTIDGKDYCAVYAVLLFAAAFLDMYMGCFTNPVLTPAPSISFYILNLIPYKPFSLTLHGGGVSPVRLKIKHLNWTAKNVVGPLEDINLFSQKVHMLHHVIADVARYRDLNLVDAAPFEHFNSVAKRYIRMTSMQRAEIWGDYRNYQIVLKRVWHGEMSSTWNPAFRV